MLFRSSYSVRMTVTSATRADQILVEARQVQFSRILLMLVLGFFWGTGWVAGHLWLGLVVCAVSVRRGWRDGTGYIPQQLPPVSPESMVR